MQKEIKDSEKSPKEVIQLQNANEVKELRIKWAKERDLLCPVLKKEINLEDFALDHCHSNKNDGTFDENEAGKCRDSISKRVNAFEGKVSNSYIRTGLKNMIALPDLLRNLAEYYENNKLHTESIYYSHPSEKPKEPKLKKSSFNEIKKIYKGKTSLSYPKSGKLTKNLEKIYTELGLEPEFYKA